MSEMTYQEWMERRAKIKELLACFPTVRGCSDGNCMIEKPTGMHTNGGCKCYRRIADLGLELAALADPIKDLRIAPPGTVPPLAHQVSKS